MATEYFKFNNDNSKIRMVLKVIIGFVPAYGYVDQR